ncbi:spindle pole body formation-associated protein-domain-containing protein [Annulohypoxylon moriforme]|nr:spindle pole body formation-associated protein-domain-containing protein [Annulohypoxylon moriforme]
MLGWALKKGLQGATGKNDMKNDASGGDDTTLLEAPDTPAPVFAARAIKNAIFGTSNASEATTANEKKQAKLLKKNKANEKINDKIENATEPIMNSPPTKQSQQSPTKQPTSILLTPGTGTARRKRVSFNHDVKAGSSLDSSPSASARQRKRTNLQAALERSRKKRPSSIVEEHVPLKTVDEKSEDEWEDDIDIEDRDSTVDLNEPHSESGKFWKAEFTRYRDEAMADLERMVKFKALAKSYAKKKDAEALELAQQLKEEQVKVAKLEEKLAATSTQAPNKRRRGSDEDNGSLKEELAKQTALATRYREQARDLAAALKNHEGDASSSQFDRERHINTSPRTEKTLIDVQRELRRARSELKHMDKLREDVKKLRSDLSAAEKRATDLLKQGQPDSYRTKNLELELREAQDKLRRKDLDMRELKNSYDSLKNDAKKRTAEAIQVLQEKNEKITKLEGRIRELEDAKPWGKATRDLVSNIDSLGKTSEPSKHEGARAARYPRRTASVESLNLEKTKSQLGDMEEPKMGSRFGRRPNSLFASDWSDSYKDMKSQLSDEKTKQMAENKKLRDSIMEDDPPPRSGAKAKNSLLSQHDTGRVMSSVLQNRLNQDSTSFRARSGSTPANDFFNQKLAEARAAARADKDTEMHGGRSPVKTRSHSNRPVSFGGEALSFDLLEDKFARVDGPEAERSSANASRSTLSAERKAAAQARLDQKKRERQKNNSGDRSRDKENVKL